jgi:thioredoxin reductase (NADPH)
MSPVRPEVTVVGRRLEPEHHRLRDLLTRMAQPFRWLEADSADASAALAAAGLGPGDELPALIEEDGTVIAPASVVALAEAWNERALPARAAYDIAIIGAGPAGLAAAVYASSDGLSTVLIDEDVPGGQASHTSRIENFFGFPGGIGGAELARLAGRQAEGFGAELLLLRGVTGSRHEPGGPFEVRLADDVSLEAKVVVAAPGMVWRRLEAEGIEGLLGRGIYYGAGRSEAGQCANNRVVVVGAGNSAGQAVLNLAAAGAEVTILVRGDSLSKSMSAYLVERIAASSRIDVRLRTEVQAVEEFGDCLGAVRVKEAGGAEERLPAEAMFLCLGGVPRTGWAPSQGVELGPGGFILTGPDLLRGGERPEAWPLERDPLAVETSVPGLFAAGDVRSGSTKRVAGAVGDGAMAVALAHRRLDEIARDG